MTLAGHDVRTVGDGRSFFDLLARHPADLVILDVGLPGEDGLSIARRLRRESDVGIIMLTGAGELVDRVVGLEVGADDYVTKPFGRAELEARVNAVLRRRSLSAGTVPFGPFTFDRRSWRLREPDGREIPLFPTEIDLVAALATKTGRQLSRDERRRLAPAHGSDPIDRSIDTRIARLRRKLEENGFPADTIETSRGNGYIYKGAAR